MIIQDAGTMVIFSSLRGEHIDGVLAYDFLKSLRSIPAKKVFVADEHDLWYRNYSLADLTVELTLGRRIFMGHSAGGYAAIVYGCQLNAKGIIAFAPQIIQDDHWKNFAPHIDAVEAIGNAPDTEIHVVVCKRAANDRKHVAHIEHFDNVTVHMLDDATHNAARIAVKNGLMLKLIDKLFGGE